MTKKDSPDGRSGVPYDQYEINSPGTINKQAEEKRSDKAEPASDYGGDGGEGDAPDAA